jgi:hypothetical protein
MNGEFMKTTLRYQPCPHTAKAIQKIAESSESEQLNSIFMKYVKYHVSKCPQCQAALDMMKCYHESIGKAYEDAVEQGVDRTELSAMLDRLDRS